VLTANRITNTARRNHRA